MFTVANIFLSIWLSGNMFHLDYRQKFLGTILFQIESFLRQILFVAWKTTGFVRHDQICHFQWRNFLGEKYESSHYESFYVDLILFNTFHYSERRSIWLQWPTHWWPWRRNTSSSAFWYVEPIVNIEFDESLAIRLFLLSLLLTRVCGQWSIKFSSLFHHHR